MGRAPGQLTVLLHNKPIDLNTFGAKTSICLTHYTNTITADILAPCVTMVFIGWVSWIGPRLQKKNFNYLHQLKISLEMIKNANIFLCFLNKCNVAWVNSTDPFCGEAAE